MKTTFRPSHADFTYQAKYGIRNWQGGGRVLRARNHRSRGGRGRRAQGSLGSFSRHVEIIAYVRQVHEVDGERGSRTGIAAQMSKQRRALPGRGAGEKDDCIDRKSPRRRRFARRRDRVRGPRHAGRSGRTGLRQTRGGPGQGNAQPARHERLRNRFGFRWQRGCEARSTTMRLKCGASEFARRRISPAGSRVGSPMASKYYFRVAFKPTATIARPQKTVTASKKARRWRPAAGTIRVFFLALCRWWKPWRQWFCATMLCGRGPFRIPSRRNDLRLFTLAARFHFVRGISILFEVLRGWRLGLMRQLVRLGASFRRTSPPISVAHSLRPFSGRS